MAKRYKKRSNRRKRFSRKRRSKRKVKKYDAAYSAICRTTLMLTADTVSSGASMVIHWGASGSSGTKDLYIDDCAEFSSLKGFW